jgi:hypothetical protein
MLSGVSARAMVPSSTVLMWKMLSYSELSKIAVFLIHKAYSQDDQASQFVMQLSQLWNSRKIKSVSV